MVLSTCIICRCYLQKRVLNLSKGPAVRALRAQTDKREYAMEMRRVVERQVLCFFFFWVKLQVYAIIVTLSNWTFVNYSVDCSFHFVHSINRRRK